MTHPAAHPAAHPATRTSRGGAAPVARVENVTKSFGLGDGRVRLDLAIVFGSAALFLVAGPLTLRRTEA